HSRHEPPSTSLPLLFTGDCSVSALMSVPARTVVFPLTLTFRPLRLRTIGGAPAPLPPAPPPLGAAAPGPAAAPGAGAAPLGAAAPGPAAAPGAGTAPLGAPPPPPPRPPTPAVIPMRPKSPLQTATFQVGSILQALSSSAIPLSITI